MSPFLTSKENIAVNLIYQWLGECRTNRTYDEYMTIASRFPKLEACYAYVNQRLGEMAQRGIAPYGICYFKAGDRYPWHEEFPTSARTWCLSNTWVSRSSNRMFRDSLSP